MGIFKKKAVFEVCADHPNYLVSKDGRIYCENIGELVKPIKIGGVSFVEIWAIDTRQYIKVAEMIARTYLEHDQNDRLKCINGNWNDYSLTNYVWCKPRRGAGSVEWRLIANYQTYEVSNGGWVRNNRSKNMLRPTFKDGKLCVRLYNCKTHSTRICEVEKLVYEAFVRKPAKRYIMSHLDNDPLNNCVDNLKCIGLAKRYLFRGKPVCAYSPNGEFIKKWRSAAAAARECNIKVDHIRQCCNGQKSSVDWKAWRWDGDPFEMYVPPDISKLQKGEHLKNIPGTYAYISDHGRVIDSRKEGHIYTPNSWDKVKITTNGKTLQKKVYLLVAEAFLPNPHGYKRVEFIDGNSKNWNVSNLRWAKSLKDK